MAPLVTSSDGDSELTIHFQETYARLFSNCCNKQDIQSNLPSYRPMNQGTICAKVHYESLQPIKGSICGLIPESSGRSSFSNRRFLYIETATSMYTKIRNNYTTVCLPVGGDNPRALASRLSPVQAGKPWYNYFIPPSSVQPTPYEIFRAKVCKFRQG